MRWRLTSAASVSNSRSHRTISCALSDGNDFAAIITLPSSCVASAFGKQMPYNVVLVSFTTPNCPLETVIAHEVMHALGARHTHTRPDRDTKIDINFNNLDVLFFPSLHQCKIIILARLLRSIPRRRSAYVHHVRHAV